MGLNHHQRRRLTFALPLLGACIAVFSPVAALADAGDTGGLTDGLNQEAGWSALQIEHYDAKLQTLSVVAAWTAQVEAGDTNPQCNDGQCPPASASIGEAAHVQPYSWYCAPDSGHNVLATFYTNGWQNGYSSTLPSPDQLAANMNTTSSMGTPRGNVAPALNLYQDFNTYALKNLTTADDVWNANVTDIWGGYGPIWNIESYDQVTGAHPLYWYPSGDIKHYFPTFGYNSNHTLDVFDENNALSNHYYQVTPDALFAASVANNRTNGVQPQVIW